MSNKSLNKKSPEYQMERVCRRPWESYVAPIKMGDGVYYISGNDWVASYLIETSEGLIIIDTGVHESLYLMIENIKKLGFNLKDIKKILISHAHIDHLGGARSLMELTGAKLYIGERDAFILNDRKDLLFNEEGLYTCGDIIPDEFYDDKSPIILGDTTIHTVATPGHTPGTTSFFFERETEAGKMLKFGLHGGLGLNTLTKDFFRETGLPLSLRYEYINSLKSMMKIHVDVCLPSHTNQAPLLELVDKISKDNNPYINSEVWPRLMKHRLDSVINLIESES